MQFNPPAAFKTERDKSDPAYALNDQRLNHGSPSSAPEEDNYVLSSSSSGSSASSWISSLNPILHSSAKKLSFIGTTPTEVLAHVFSFLDPTSLRDASLVCREWHSVISDDLAWKAAFLRYFGTQKVSRLAESWRGEYIHRTHLLRKWESGHGKNQVYDTHLHLRLTHLSTIPAVPSRAHLSTSARDLKNLPTQNFLLHGSLPHGGLVTLSEPTTSRVERAILLPSPNNFNNDVQCIAFSPNQAMGIVAYGMRTGTVSINEIASRRNSKGGWKGMNGWHRAAVVSICILDEKLTHPMGTKWHKNDEGEWVGDVGLISCALDGSVRFWDMRSRLCVSEKILPKHVFQDNSEEDNPLVKLEYDFKRKILVGATSKGEIWVLRQDGNEEALWNSEFKRLLGSKWTEDGSTPQIWREEEDSGLLSMAVNVEMEIDIHQGFVVVLYDGILKRIKYTNEEADGVGFDMPGRTRKIVAFAMEERDKEIGGNETESLRHAAAGEEEGLVWIWNIRGDTGESGMITPLHRITSPTSGLTTLALNSLVFITGHSDGTVRAHDLISMRTLRQICGPTARRHRYPHPNGTNVVALRLAKNTKSEIRGVIGFESGLLRYWDFAPEGVVGNRSSKERKKGKKKGRRKEARARVEHTESDFEDMTVSERRREAWSGSAGDLEEQEALQFAIMLSREEEVERQRTILERIERGEAEDHLPENYRGSEQSEDEDNDPWLPGRKVSFGSTSGGPSTPARYGTVSQNNSSESPFVGGVSFREFHGQGSHTRRESERIREREQKYEKDLAEAIRLSLEDISVGVEEED